MATARLDKVNATLQEYIGEIIQKEVDYSRDCLITITHVETSPDLQHAKVFVSVLPDSRRGSALELLRRSAGRVKGVLAKRLKMKFTPNLHFMIDEQEVFAQGVEKILDEMRDN